MAYCRIDHPHDPVRTLQELYARYSSQWPAAGPMDRADFRNLLDRAEKAAVRFPLADFWPTVDTSLRDAMNSYDPTDGRGFDGLFMWKLTERLKRKHIRSKKKEIPWRRVKRFDEDEDYAAPVGDDESVFRDWCKYMLRRARPYLAHELVVYMAMKVNEESVADMAKALGTTEDKLNNRYGSADKLKRAAMKGVRQAVNTLPLDHRKLLVRHLRAEVGLSETDVETLLGVTIQVDDKTPLLDQKELLATIGWPVETGFSEDSSAYPA